VAQGHFTLCPPFRTKPPLSTGIDVTIPRRFGLRNPSATWEPRAPETLINQPLHSKDLRRDPDKHWQAYTTFGAIIPPRGVIQDPNNQSLLLVRINTPNKSNQLFCLHPLTDEIINYCAWHLCCKVVFVQGLAPPRLRTNPPGGRLALPQACPALKDAQFPANPPLPRACQHLATGIRVVYVVHTPLT
jgi:hypothetical protein